MARGNLEHSPFACVSATPAITYSGDLAVERRPMAVDGSCTTEESSTALQRGRRAPGLASGSADFMHTLAEGSPTPPSTIPPLSSPIHPRGVGGESASSPRGFRVHRSGSAREFHVDSAWPNCGELWSARRSARPSSGATRGRPPSTRGGPAQRAGPPRRGRRQPPSNRASERRSTPRQRQRRPVSFSSNEPTSLAVSGSRSQSFAILSTA